MEINVNKYIASHGKQPRGYGQWAFCPAEHYNSDNYIEHTMFYTGKYTETKKSATAYFRSHNVQVIIVCP